jgi:hypothetical protein
MKIFSIQRYLAPLEVCTPLVAFILLTQLTSYQKARKAALWILSLTFLVVLCGGIGTGGHAAWSTKMFRIDLPLLEAPEKTTVIFSGIDPPFGWIAAQFPPSVAFAQVQGTFPEAMPAYGNRVHEMAQQRGGPVFTIVQAQKQSNRANQINKIREIVSRLGIISSEKGCAALRWIAANLWRHASVTILGQSIDNAQCVIDVLPDDIEDVDVKKREFSAVAAKKIAIYDFSMDMASCVPYKAFIGKDEFPFQWCQLTTTHAATNAHAPKD